MKRFLRWLHLWLIAHGIELETYREQGSVVRSFSIAINHRFYGVDIGLRPFRGVYTDELDTPHAEIAQQHAEKGAE